MMRLKHVINHPVSRFIISWIASIYIRFVCLTQRWETIIPPEVSTLIEQKRTVIFCFWHGRLFLTANFTPKHYHMGSVISLHKDGEWIARIVKFLGTTLIRGSSSKGGVSAIKTSLNWLKEPAHALGITPDGPRGPRMRIGGNMLEIAKRSGAPIIGFTYSTSRAKHLKTWDRFLLSFPFGKAIAIYGQPHYIHSTITDDEMLKAKQAIEDEMNTLTHRADEKMGFNKILPADKPKAKRTAN